MNIFPVTPDLIQKEKEVFREYAIDFETGEFIYVDGKNVILEGKEALEVWIWKVLQITKGKYLAYNNTYGNEFETIIGSRYSKGLIDSELRRLTEEALTQNKHIKSISNFKSTFINKQLNINLTVNTEFGGVDVAV